MEPVLVMVLVALIGSIVSLAVSIVVLIATVRVHRRSARIERIPEPALIPELASGASITACVPCDRYWVPRIFGPQEGDPCPQCKRPVTAHERA